MKPRDEFVAMHKERWRELDSLLDRAAPLGGAELSRLSMRYRELCADLMSARSARYGVDLITHLDALAARAHSALYGHERGAFRSNVQQALRSFPAALREARGFLLASASLFGLPLAVGVASTLLAPKFAEAVLPAEQLEAMAEMYSKSVSTRRAAGTDAAMAGFYVWNNVGIAFRCFATGVLFGLGSVFFLVYNGLVIGAVTGHVVNSGHGENILTFMSGHAAYELGAIVVAGAAGLRLGYSLIATGNLTRAASLRLGARKTVPLIVGAGGMLILAALVEAFWSPSPAPYPVKWAFAAFSFAAVAAFWAIASFGSRSRA